MIFITERRKLMANYSLYDSNIRIATSKKLPGSKLILKDLLEDIWDDLELTARRDLGKKFYDKVQQGEHPHIRLTNNKTQQNQEEYEII